MSELLIITVAPSSTHPDLLVARDAFQHVLDLLELATEGSEEEDLISWRLVSVSMNSPFKLVAEAVSNREGLKADAIARTQKARFARHLDLLRSGVIPELWSTGRSRAAAKRMLERSSRGAVGSTIVAFQSESKKPEYEFELRGQDACISLICFDNEPLVESIKPKEQLGSIEGYFKSVGTYRNQPAILVCERKTGAEIWCIVSEAHRQRIASEMGLDDVWTHRRVIVRGRLIYAGNGALSRVSANDVMRLNETPGHLSLRPDLDFSDGMRSSDYLDAFREGNLG